jgi:hypothetical protein
MSDPYVLNVWEPSYTWMHTDWRDIVLNVCVDVRHVVSLVANVVGESVTHQTSYP